MTDTLLKTKLYIPPLRPNLVPRSRLIEQLNQGLYLGHKLSLVSAPAGFGKTTLTSEWVTACGQPAAWLSLDDKDKDLTRFLTYLVAAVNRIVPDIGEGALARLQSPQPAPAESILTLLLNEISAIQDNFILVLDDYHLVDAQSVDDALSFLLQHLPPQMHLVIITREDPNLPLARYRVRGQMSELRAADLRFTNSEAAGFLNLVMGLKLSAEEIAALETRTEGWIAGLQLAAISLQGLKEAASFIQSFTGSHRLVLDYLIEEVLDQQSQHVQDFLLQTAVLERLTGSLCDALTGQNNGQATLEMLERANLFIIPLDDERRWYRYHHLFADLLRQRLQRSTALSTEVGGKGADELHGRASIWYEDHGLEIEAFYHAAAANDVERAARLVEGEEVSLQYRGAVAPVLNWLESLPEKVLDAKPSLWVTYASTLNLSGQSTAAEQKLQAAEAALHGAEPDDKTNDIIGHIAATRAMMAVGQNETETIIAQSRRALAYLHPDNLPLRTTTTWTLGRAYHLQGDRAAASRAYSEVISISQASGDIVSTLAAATGLGGIQETENQLFLAAESYRSGLALFGDQPQPVACETSLGLARILYEWNDLDAALRYGRQSNQLAQQVESVDTFAISGVLLARIKLVQGDGTGAAALAAQAGQFMCQHDFVDRRPEVTAIQVLTLLRQGNLSAAADLAEKHKLPISQARVHLAQGDASAAAAVLEPWRQQVEAKGLQDEQLKVMVLQAVALHAQDEKVQAVQLLDEVLAMAEPGGFVRTFVDEGPPMARLLHDARKRKIAPDYVRRLLAAFPDSKAAEIGLPKSQASKPEWYEPLSDREIEVLQLIAEGLTNQEIAARLFISLHTVKVHARNIFAKLDIKNRTQAAAKGKTLGILPQP